jgi:hypothetical protein
MPSDRKFHDILEHTLSKILTVCVASLLYGLFPQAAAEAAPHQTLRIAEGWKLFRGKEGVVLSCPGNWVVNEMGNGVVVYRPGPSGGANALVVSQPVQIEGRAVSVVRGIGQVLPDLFPNAQVSHIRKIASRPETIQGALQFHAGGHTFVGTALCVKEGNNAVLYAMASTQSAWPRDRHTMANILKSIFYTAPSAASPGRLPAMRRWVDPLEKAFSCPVPAGWNVQGGTVRKSATDVRQELVATSPDGNIQIRFGDSAIPPMTLPTPMMESTGFREGSWYSPGYGVQMLVMRYLPGYRALTDFYLPSRIGGFTVVNVRDLPQIAQQLQRLSANAGFNYRYDTGEVYFTTRTPQGEKAGYCFVETEFIGNMNSGMWTIPQLACYLVTPGYEAQAAVIMNKMASECETNPVWLREQLKLTSNVSGIVFQTNQAMSRIIRQTFRERERVQDRTHQRFSRAIRGTVLVEDPRTGEKFEVPMGGRYYWRARSGQNAGKFVGTPTDSPPYPLNEWFDRMTVLDR